MPDPSDLEERSKRIWGHRCPNMPGTTSYLWIARCMMCGAERPAPKVEAPNLDWRPIKRGKKKVAHLWRRTIWPAPRLPTWFSHCGISLEHEPAQADGDERKCRRCLHSKDVWRTVEALIPTGAEEAA